MKKSSENLVIFEVKNSCRHHLCETKSSTFTESNLGIMASGLK